MRAPPARTLQGRAHGLHRGGGPFSLVNRIRGLLAEFGLVFAQSPAALESVLADVLEDASNEMNTLARLVLQRAQGQWRELDAHLDWCDQRIAAPAKDNNAVKAAATLIGIGPVTASASVATVGDFKQFTNGAQFGAWIPGLA